MEYIQKKLKKYKLSKESLAEFLGISIENLLALERGEDDPKLSTLREVATGMGYPAGILDQKLARLFKLPIDSIAVISEGLLIEGEESWKIFLFNFVDAFRSNKDSSYIDEPPAKGLSKQMEALITSTVEALCDELEMTPPNWCSAVPPLEKPWFVSGIEALKAIALIECPMPYRKRNVFVHSNFLSRA